MREFVSGQSTLWAVFVLLLMGMLGRNAVCQPDESVLSGQVELARLVDLAANRLGLNIEYDASQLRGSVTFRLGEPITDEELWALTNRLLAARGFTTIRRAGENTIGVVPLNEASGLARLEFGDDGADAAALPGYRAVIVRPRHTTPDRLVSALRVITSSKGGSISRIAETDLLLISDLAPRIDQLLGVLDALDTDGETLILRRVQLRTTSAGRLIPQLTQLVAKRQLAGGGKLDGETMPGSTEKELLIVTPQRAMPAWLDLIETLDRSESMVSRTYQPRYFALGSVSSLIRDLVTPHHESTAAAPAIRIVENTLTGSLVITATPEQHDIIEGLLEELASAPLESRRTLRTFVLRNRNAAEVRRLLDDLLSQGVLEETAEPGGIVRPDHRPGDGGSPRFSDTGGQAGRDQRLRLATDEGTNTLIAAGDPRLLDQIASLLAQLDVRRPQVMLEVLLVSLTESQTLDLGVELQQVISDSGTLIGLGSLFGLSAISPFSGGGDGSVPGTLPGAGGTAVILDPGNFSAVVRALETVNKGRSLSMPRVLVNDNEAATINSVVQEPFVSINASDTVATTSFGGFESAGTTVSVTPQIAEGDHLSLRFSITLSSFTGESSSASSPPPRQQNNISSVATIPDGYTIAVGGIELTSDGEAENRVPLLGTLPLLGDLFKTRSSSGSRSRFYAFLRADVYRHHTFADLKHTSAAMRESVELPDDDPVLLPRIIR